jgi:HEAT repeat protein
MKHHAHPEGKTMRNLLMMLVLGGAFVFAAALPVLAQNADPVAVLKSDAAFLDKLEACRVLELKGGPEAVPALEALLTDEKLSHPARLALEAMPCAEAGTALRGALGKTVGILKVGIIGSLAIRKDAAAVPELTGLLPDKDAAVAQAAAAALGRLATPEAVEALQKAVALPNLPPVTLVVFCNGLLDCAEALAALGKGDQALAIYDGLLENKNTASQVRAAALRGAALSRGGAKGVALLVNALEGEDQAEFDAALRALREVGAKDAVAGALAGVLPILADDRKLAVMQVLGECGGEAAGPALLAEAQKEPVEVQVAALRAMTRIGYVPALELVKNWINSQSVELSSAAQDSLRFFPGKEGDDMLKALLQSGKADERRMAVELIGKGGLDEPAGILMGVAKSDTDEGVRVAALQALRNHAGMDEAPTLLNHLMTAGSQAEMDAAESVLAAVCGRQQKAAPGELVVQEAVYGSLPDGPSANVTGRVAQIVSGGALSVAASNNLFGDTAPGLVKKLRVNYTVKGVAATQTVQEGETLVLNTASVPQILTESLTAMLQQAPADRKPAFLRLLGTTGSSRALETVKNLAFHGEDGPVKDLALREVCNWSAVEALPTVLDLALNAKNPDVKVLALRGAVRLLGQPQVAMGERLKQYAVLMDKAGSADDKKLVLSGLAQVRQTDALDMVLNQFSDEAVKAEAVQAAINIAKGLGKSAKEDNSLYDGKDITDWQGDKAYWRFENGVIIGGGDKPVAKNEFLWAPGTVGDFYLAVDVKLEPNTANAGIQFRSKKADESGQALGYQADIGKGYWGQLYHEHGRGKLDSTERAEEAVKPEDWNHYEILAVGPAVWTAINGKLGAAYLEPQGAGERTGAIAVQIHSGPPQTVQYKFVKLVHNPEIKLAGFDAKRLFTELKATEQK